MGDFFAGVPSSYEDLYLTLVFFAALWLVGDVLCSRFLRVVPSLVGHIAVGILFGPEGLNLIRPSPEQYVVLGNLGLLMIIMQAGLEMDYQTLKRVGSRGVVIAIVGSILPILIGTGIAALLLDSNSGDSATHAKWKSALAAGCSFGPTSAGIAMNVLGQCKVLNMPVGQLIVAAAIVDDILALVVLSQLRSLTAPKDSLASIGDIVIPIVSAILWIFVGGYIALFVIPKVLQSEKAPKILSKSDPHTNLLYLFGLLFGLLPATYYTRASYLLGSFLAGLAFCQDETGLDSLLRKEFNHVMKWLMKIFFAATIGFQVPIRSFGDGLVIARGFLFALALLGKLLVGALAPNFHGSIKNYQGMHLRDCVVVGLSMMGEAEFAFVVAVFGVTEGLIPPDIYASIVLAILLSTIISPLFLKIALANWGPLNYADEDVFLEKDQDDHGIVACDEEDDNIHLDVNEETAYPKILKHLST